MGRKKIEIRPLVDERNRNVTFLKRKAGLMKKAWELSVLCAADVSIIIFSHAGKPYEFSSRELDGELDRYLEYEGSIERRRAPEFAAMAAAGEDDDDEDEDDNPRRPSKAGANSAANGAPVPRSLKGKESYKARMPTLSEMSRNHNKRKRSHRERERDRDDEKRGFIEGLLKREDSDDDDDVLYDGKVRHQTDVNALQYAMNMHNQPMSSSSRSFRPDQLPFSSSYPPQPQLYGNASLSAGPYPPPQMNAPMPPNSMQWDQNMLAKYAEFQLQQNHQRQQRLLLERQRQQLAELGIPIDDSGLLDQLFGGGSSSLPVSQPSSAASSVQPQNVNMMGLNMDMNANIPTGGSSGMSLQTPGSTTMTSAEEGNSFIWPTFANQSRRDSNHQQQPHPIQTSYQGNSNNGSNMLDQLYSSSTQHPSTGSTQTVHARSDEFRWPTNHAGSGSSDDQHQQQGGTYLPSPASAEERVVSVGASALYGLSGKRSLEGREMYSDLDREDKRQRLYA